MREKGGSPVPPQQPLVECRISITPMQIRADWGPALGPWPGPPPGPRVGLSFDLIDLRISILNLYHRYPRGDKKGEGCTLQPISIRNIKALPSPLVDLGY